MAKHPTRFYAALVDGDLLGKRSTKTMFYTHVTVARFPGMLPGQSPWAAQSWHQSERAGLGFATSTRGYHPDWEVRLVPAVLVDKDGKRIEQVAP